MFIVLRFGESLATKCVPQNNEPCMARHDLNPGELNYCQFMSRLDRCNRSCNAVDDLSTKICVPSKTKGIKLKYLTS